MRVANVSADKRWSRKITENFHTNKIFWKEVQRIRKGTSENKERLKTGWYNVG